MRSYVLGRGGEDVMENGKSDSEMEVEDGKGKGRQRERRCEGLLWGDGRVDACVEEATERKERLMEGREEGREM